MKNRFVRKILLVFVYHLQRNLGHVVMPVVFPVTQEQPTVLCILQACHQKKSSCPQPDVFVHRMVFLGLVIKILADVFIVKQENWPFVTKIILALVKSTCVQGLIVAIMVHVPKVFAPARTIIMVKIVKMHR